MPRPLLRIRLTDEQRAELGRRLGHPTRLGALLRQRGCRWTPTGRAGRRGAAGPTGA
jgi:hypothetical protein